MGIDIQQLGKTFGTQPVLRGIDLAIKDRELVALLGPSGSGKTTLLRILAGLEWPDRGDVVVNGQSWLDQPPQTRGVGLVFQHYALFEHMTIAENIAFGLRVRSRARRPANDVILAKVEELLDLMELGGLGKRYPAQLSGGQRQRVALARALAIEPQVLLLDEPFGALDARVRRDLRRWLRGLHDRLGMTTVFVTHDQEEALEIADRIVILNEGRIEQMGSAEEIYDHPASPFVQRFLGGVNEVPLRLLAGRIEVDGIEPGVLKRMAIANDNATLFIRPRDIDVAPNPNGSATIQTVSFLGDQARLELAFDGDPTVIEAELGRDQLRTDKLGRGQRVQLKARQGRLYGDGSAAAPL
jgi:sulfate transport system ATP-binding protein